jgi:hypothetical protein
MFTYALVSVSDPLHCSYRGRAFLTLLYRYEVRNKAESGLFLILQ